MTGPSEGDLGRLVQRTLEFGVLAAVLLLALGLAAALALGELGAGAIRATGRPISVLAGAGGEIGTALILLGVLVLVATPILRVGVSLGWFAHARDSSYTAITATVLGVLALTVWIGLVL